MAERVAVTGAEGFIGSHLVEALVARGRRVRAMVQYNSFSLAGLAGDAAAGRARPGRGGARRRPRSGLGPGVGGGQRHRLPPGRPDRDPVLLPGAPQSTWTPTSAAPCNVLEAVRECRHPAAGAHLDERDVRDGADGADQRGPPDLQAQSPYAASKVGRRTSWRRATTQLRDARGDAAAVQHLRAAPVDAGRHPAVIGQVAARRDGGRRWATCGRPGTSTTSPTPRAAFLAVGTAPRRAGRRPDLQRRDRRRDLRRRPGQADRQAHGHRPGRARGSAAAAAAGLGGDAAGLRRLAAARRHRLGPARTAWRKGCPAPSSSSATRRNLARYKTTDYNV